MLCSFDCEVTDYVLELTFPQALCLSTVIYSLGGNRHRFAWTIKFWNTKFNERKKISWLPSFTSSTLIHNLSIFIRRRTSKWGLLFYMQVNTAQCRSNESYLNSMLGFYNISKTCQLIQEILWLLSKRNPKQQQQQQLMKFKTISIMVVKHHFISTRRCAGTVNRVGKNIAAICRNMH